MNHVARADDIQQILSIVGMRRVFHRIKVIHIAKEFVKAVNTGQVFIEIPEVVLTELAGGVAHGLQHGGNGHRLGRYAYFRASLADGVIPVRIGSSPVMKFARPAVQLASA